MTGPFCGRCGAAAGAAGQPAQPQQAPQPQAQPYQAQPYQGQPMGMAPARKKTSPIVWILGIIGGLLILGIVIVGVALSYFVHKAKLAGLDPELMRSNPGLALSKMAATANPDIEVLSTNDRDGTITFRDKKTGKVDTLTFDDVKSGHFKMSVKENGKTTSLDFGANAGGKLPSWVPSYPGATAKGGGFSVTASGENGDAGNFSFTTPDSAGSVQAFYESKAHDTDMQYETTTATGFGTVVKLTEPRTGHTIAVTIIGSGPTTVNVTYAAK
jgi:hypothetical protein